MRHGKDFMSDKPGMTSLDQLAEVRCAQQETRRIYSILYSERFENAAQNSEAAGRLIVSHQKLRRMRYISQRHLSIVYHYKYNLHRR